MGKKKIIDIRTGKSVTREEVAKRFLPPVLEFEPDEWLRVRADNAEAARKFFGAPPNWPVRFAGFDERRPGRIWEVLADGLTIGA